MTPRTFLSALLAYIFSSLTVLVLAAVLSKLLRGWGIEVFFWEVGAVLWSASVGQISLRWSLEKLGRSLSVRPAPSLRIARGGLRAIPIAGDTLADATRWVGGRGAGPGGEVLVADEIFITCGEFVFSEVEILNVLRRGWVRQRAGQAPLSRRYWLGREPFLGDRRKYDAFADSLDAVGATVGRSDGRSGKMIKPPLSTIRDLRHRALVG